MWSIRACDGREKHMKFACLNAIAPAHDIADQCRLIAQAGCSGVEAVVFPDTDLATWQDQLMHATAEAGLSVAAVIIGGLALHQQSQREYIRRVLDMITRLNGAAAVVTPQYEAQSPLPLFPPYPAPDPVAVARVREALADLDTDATNAGVSVFIEPITQFESAFCRDVIGTLALIERQPHLKLCLDFHNMNITEADIVASLELAASRIGHIHVADNNRRMPGEGHINYAPGLRALCKMGYTGWYSFECSTQGSFVEGVSTSINILSTCC